MQAAVQDSSSHCARPLQQRHRCSAISSSRSSPLTPAPAAGSTCFKLALQYLAPTRLLPPPQQQQQRRPVRCSGGGGGKRSKYSQSFGPRGSRDPLFLEVQPDGSDSWRLDAVVDLLREGGVGVIPTDSFPALVCDIENKSAVQRLYDIQQLPRSKLLSILVRGFKDVSTYTLGFAASSVPGQVDGFHLAKRVLPGPYTIILSASKALPKTVDFGSGKSKSRRTVGVRMPDDTVCQAILERLERPLLASSVTGPDAGANSSSDGGGGAAGTRVPDPVLIFDEYAPRGIDFMVSTGGAAMAVWTAGSTVVDMTSAVPKILREGEGDAEIFRREELAV